MIDYILESKGPQKILIGRAIYDETYQNICRKAVNDGCFGEKECNHRTS